MEASPNKKDHEAMDTSCSNTQALGGTRTDEPKNISTGAPRGTYAGRKETDKATNPEKSKQPIGGTINSSEKHGKAAQHEGDTDALLGEGSGTDESVTESILDTDNSPAKKQKGKGKKRESSSSSGSSSSTTSSSSSASSTDEKTKKK